MASNTSNLGLLKKDPLTDGKDTFNIRTMLNDNWDKIDEFAGETIPISRGGTGATTAEQALANLGGIAAGAVGNLHVWERVQTYADPVPEVPAGYTFGSEQSVVAVGTSDGSSYYCTIYYADSVTVSSDGVVSLSNPSNQRNRIYDWIGSSTLSGKFCIMGEYDGSTNLVKPTENGGVVFYVPSGGTIAYNESTKQITISKYQSVTGYPYTPAIPAGTTTDYLTSTDRDAYTDGTVGNTTITYLGQLGEPGAKIEVGSYVGTGTYGSSNPCSVSASFPIKRLSVFGEIYADTGKYFPIYENSNNSSYSMNDILLTTSFASRRGIHYGTSNYNLDHSFGKKSVDGRTFWWYSSGNAASFQLNESGSIYYYIAIG